MPVLTACPYCGFSFQVADQYAGLVIQCPHCARPVQSASAFPTLEDEAPFKSVSRKRSHASSMPVFVVITLLGASCLVGAWYTFLKPQQALVAVAEKAQPEKVQPVDPPKKAAQEKTEKATLAKTADSSTPTAEVSFEEAWEKMLMQSDQCDAEEPELTTKALRGLPPGGRELVLKMMKDARADPEHLIPDLPLRIISTVESAYGKIYALDFVPLASKQSRSVAQIDPEFKEVARTVWEVCPDQTNGLLGMMNTWTITSTGFRKEAIKAIKTKTPPEKLTSDVKKAVLEIAGPSWFV